MIEGCVFNRFMASVNIETRVICDGYSPQQPALHFLLKTSQKSAACYATQPFVFGQNIKK